MDLEKLISLGEKLGHKDAALQKFVKDEQARLQKQADDDKVREDRRIQRELDKAATDQKEREAARQEREAAREHEEKRQEAERQEREAERQEREAQRQHELAMAQRDADDRGCIMWQDSYCSERFGLQQCSSST